MSIPLNCDHLLNKSLDIISANYKNISDEQFSNNSNLSDFNFIDIVYIYALTDNENTVRYVGKTNNPHKRRLKHISDAKNLVGNRHKCNWIRKVIKSGNSINIKILETCKDEDWINREKFWISQFKNLVNISEGGESGGNKKYHKTFKYVKNWVNKNIPDLKIKEDWLEYIKNNTLPKFIPKHPYTAYKCKGWISWGDFLNNGKETFLDYINCKIWIKNNYPNITTQKTWRQNKHLFPGFIPKRPDSTYSKSGWISWKSFYQKEFMSYDDCKKWLNYNYPKINTRNYFDIFSKSSDRPLNIPSCPYIVYKDNGWISWSKFLR